MNSNELFASLRKAAVAFASQDEFGALHIVVADGNVEDEHIEYCLEQPGITAAEKEFAEMLLSFPKEQRAAIYAFADCSDVVREASP